MVLVSGPAAVKRSVVLVTGMSGTGKSTVLAALESRGRRVVDTDDPGWLVEAEGVDGVEALWDLDRMVALLEGHRSGWMFIAGCVANQGVMYERFDAVVLLSAPLSVLLMRVADRVNPFGSQPEQREKIELDVARFEPVLRAGASHEVVTTAPVEQVVAKIEGIAASTSS